MSVHSEGEGKGTTFTITLPFVGVVNNQNETESVHPTQGEEVISFDGLPSLQGLKVLVVDDEADTRELIREVLMECGSEVITSNSAADALVALEEHKPDILISDLGMPDEDHAAPVADQELISRGGSRGSRPLRQRIGIERRQKRLDGGAGRARLQKDHAAVGQRHEPALTEQLCG